MENAHGTNQATLLFACAGGSNVGQISNDVCRELTWKGKGVYSVWPVLVDVSKVS